MLIKTFVRIQRFVRLHNGLPNSVGHDVPGSATICQYNLGSYSFMDQCQFHMDKLLSDIAKTLFGNYWLLDRTQQANQYYC
jgi:hypothetical protein